MSSDSAKNKAFNKALDNFTFDMAGRGAVRHLFNLGMSAAEIHDELLFEVDDGHEEEAIQIIRAAMERQPFAAFDIPIVAEGEHGTCFGKLRELEV